MRKTLEEVQRAEREAIHSPAVALPLLEDCMTAGRDRVSAPNETGREMWIARSLNTLIESLGGSHELSRLFYKNQRAYEAFNATAQQKTAALEQMLNILSEAHNELRIRSESVKRIPNKPQRDQTSIFVVHGRDLKLRDAIFEFLRSLKLEPLEWSTMVNETNTGAPFIGDVLDAGMSKAQAVVVLFTPDDEARLRQDLLTPSDGSHERDSTPQPRPNVLFEAGLAFGRHPESTILVQVGEMRPFSDIAGRHIVRLDNSPQRRLEFANRLQTVGCKIDLQNESWLTAGDFWMDNK